MQIIRTIDGKELMTIADAAKMCGVIPQSIYNWIKDGRLAIEMDLAGRVKLVDRKAVLAASASYQKTKPRSKKPKEIKKAAA